MPRVAHSKILRCAQDDGTLAHFFTGSERSEVSSQAAETARDLLPTERIARIAGDSSTVLRFASAARNDTDHHAIFSQALSAAKDLRQRGSGMTDVPMQESVPHRSCFYNL